MKTVLIIGAGPAGLAAAHTFSKDNNYQVIVAEASAELGGLSKTVKYQGYLFDLGGHRFYTKSPEVQKFWESILPGNEFLIRKRSSQIYFKKIFFKYPLKLSECLFRLPLSDSIKVLLSYAYSNLKFKKINQVETFESWMHSRMGKYLFDLFFKSYTEKVWGIPCAEISPDWAKQRINDLSILALIKKILKPRFFRTSTPKSIIEYYHYPKYGPGQMWEACYEQCLKSNIDFRLKTKYTKAELKDGKWHVQLINPDGLQIVKEVDHLISTVPFAHFCKSIDSQKIFNEELLSKFTHRHFSTVVLMGKGEVTIEDQWIYIQDREKLCGRVQFYHNWSPLMVPGPGHFSIGMEFFHSDNDLLGKMSEEQLTNVGMQELRELGILTDRLKIDFTKVVKAKFAYPVYHLDYKEEGDKLLGALKATYPNAHVIGRNGMHRYNNQDHSILTGIICAQNVMAGKELRNPWKVNHDAIYIEAYD